MKTTQEWLKLIRAQLIDEGYEEPTKYRIAKVVGVSEVTISSWEAGKQMDDESAIKVADYLKRDRQELLLSAAWSRTRSEGARKTWEKLGKTLAGTAVAILLLSGMPDQLELLNVANVAQAGEPVTTVYYVKWLLALIACSLTYFSHFRTTSRRDRASIAD